MPNWSKLLDTINAQKVNNPDVLNQLRRKYLSDISQITHRNVISYYSAWLKVHDNPEVSITENDKNAFMNAVYGMDKNAGLDLILHTPGGDLAATEGIVTYLKDFFNGNIRAIIPQISMSAGTMIAMSCQEIIMGRQSSMGPIDPQLNGFACQAILDEFALAVGEVSHNPASLGLWQTIIGQLTPTFLTSCQNAIKWSKELAEEWLRDVNPSIDMKKVDATFINHNNSHSHSRRIAYKDCLAAGLNIKMLESDQKLQEAVLSLHHCNMILMDMLPIVKVIENHFGCSYIVHHNQVNP